MQMIWDFFQNQFLGMKWLNVVIGNLLISWGFDINEQMGG
ncbi:MAG: permease, partial [Acholeplasmataceae bacterium]|nr:permease [Acholeplasmataceae bacterium]